jgi:N-acetylmuramoyl-L-alanine amidase
MKRGSRPPRLLAGLLVAGTLLSLLDAPGPSFGQIGVYLTVEQPLLGWRERIATSAFAGERHLLARDLARIAGSSFAWRADLGKCLLKSRRHALQFAVGNRFVLVDGARVVQIEHPVRLEGGEVFLPLSAILGPLRGTLVQHAELTGEHLSLVVDEPNAGPPRLVTSAGETRLVLAVPPHAGAGILTPRARRFVARIPYLRLPAMPGDSLAPSGLVERLRFRRDPAYLGIEFRLSPRATSYRVRRGPGDSTLVIAFAAGSRPAEFVGLAPELPPSVPRPFRVLVLDPGHGGPDSGLVAGRALREKDLTLAIARLTRLQLAELLPDVRVVLTREDDRGLTLSERVQRANRERADLYVSLHVDALEGGRLAGVTAYVAPPLLADRSLLLAGEPAEVLGRAGRHLRLVGWQRAAGRHHPEARAAAERLLAGLAADGFGPSRLRVARTAPTQGADCPAVLLECGTLTAAHDQERLATPDGLERIARSLASALHAHAQGDL